VIAEYENDTLVRKFIYGSGIDEPVCMLSSGEVYYYHYDGLGSVVALTDTSGTFVEYYEYNVFGEPTIWDVNAMEIVDSSVVGNPFMFTGREYEPETGLYYYRARFYKPSIGRFLQTDPIRYTAGLNLYTYCGNNPLNWMDPWGLDTLGIHGGDTHSWISYTNDKGKTTTYGLWHPWKGKSVLKKTGGIGLGGERLGKSDVYENRESGLGVANRYYNNLSETQKERFNKWLEKNHKYRYPTNNCSSWASDTVKEVVGEDVDADDALLLGVETPGELIESIQELEEQNPTENESSDKTKCK
jgi:RHS repeat-associated protein